MYQVLLTLDRFLNLCLPSFLPCRPDSFLSWRKDCFWLRLVLKFWFRGGDWGIILNKAPWPFVGTVCLSLLPCWIQLCAGTEPLLLPLRSEILRTMVTVEMGQPRNTLGEPESQMVYLFSSWRIFQVFVFYSTFTLSYI